MSRQIIDKDHDLKIISKIFEFLGGRVGHSPYSNLTKTCPCVLSWEGCLACTDSFLP